MRQGRSMVLRHWMSSIFVCTLNWFPSALLELMPQTRKFNNSKSKVELRFLDTALPLYVLYHFMKKSPMNNFGVIHWTKKWQTDGQVMYRWMNREHYHIPFCIQQEDNNLIIHYIYFHISWLGDVYKKCWWNAIQHWKYNDLGLMLLFAQTWLSTHIG